MLLFLLFVTLYAFSGCDGRPSTLSDTASSTPLMTTEDASRLTVSTPAQRLDQARTREQTLFGAEEEISRPVKVPGDVLQILRQDRRNQRHLPKGQSPDEMPETWFIASEIHLNDDYLVDMVVMAANPQLFGANIVPFWVFRNTRQGHQLALSVSTFGLEVLKTKTSGYRDIRTSAATANKLLTAVYSFDGTKYRQRRSSERPIRE